MPKSIYNIKFKYTHYLKQYNNFIEIANETQFQALIKLVQEANEKQLQANSSHDNSKSVQTMQSSSLFRSSMQPVDGNDYFNIDVEAHFKLNRRDSLVKTTPGF